MQTMTIGAAKALCDKFNEINKVGDPVYLVKDFGEIKTTLIKWLARPTENGNMIGLECCSGSYLLERVIPMRSVPSRLKELQVSEYCLLIDPSDPLSMITLRLKRGIKQDRWSIDKGRQCLGKTPHKRGYFHFNLELMPSSRDDKYFQEYRFGSANEAYTFWITNRAKIVASLFDRQNYIKIAQDVGEMTT